jgi:hypothetical protein
MLIIRHSVAQVSDVTTMGHRRPRSSSEQALTPSCSSSLVFRPEDLRFASRRGVDRIWTNEGGHDAIEITRAAAACLLMPLGRTACARV